jgi:hypothetical protein
MAATMWRKTFCTGINTDANIARKKINKPTNGKGILGSGAGVAGDFWKPDAKIVITAPSAPKPPFRRLTKLIARMIAPVTANDPTAAIPISTLRTINATLATGHMNRGDLLSLRRRRLFRRRRIPGAPTQLLFARAKAGEIASAGGTTVGSSTAAEHDNRPARRMIVLLAPSGKVLTVAARAAGELPGSRSPHAGCPTASAAAAAEWVNSEKCSNFLAKILLV